MRFDPCKIVEMLQRLEQQGKVFRPLVAEVAAALSKGEFQTALETNGRLHSVLESIVTARGLLREQVIHADGIGEPEQSLGELAIRAAGMVIIMEIGRVHDALRDPATLACTTAWFVGRFQRFDDVAAFLRDELCKINGIWKPYRQDQPQLTGVSDADRLTMYLTTVRIAQRALRELGQNRDVAYFLESGAGAANLPDVCTACMQIAIVLGLQIDVEPHRHLTSHPRSFGATGTASGSL